MLLLHDRLGDGGIQVTKRSDRFTSLLRGTDLGGEGVGDETSRPPGC
jgi:hypothetical protein